MCIVAPFASGAGADTPDAAPTFERDVLPILTAHCLKCHGREARKASLDMRTIVLLSRGGESGPVLKPGSIDESPLFQRISDRSMPPEGELPLTAAHIETVRRWIASGAAAVNAAADVAAADNDGASEVSAADREYWAFRKPAPHGPPTVRQTNRVRTPVDAFVLARLEECGLRFAPDADPHTLGRRAYFDLLGLPPSPQEVDEFVNDQSDGAYERLLDRLLASPHFGERWGRHWLDAAGYVDVQGGDNDAGIVKLSEGKWRYRDYVIRSFNDDKPLARFLTEQLAGDELDDWRSVEQFTPEMVEHLVATTFLRCTRRRHRRKRAEHGRHPARRAGADRRDSGQQPSRADGELCPLPQSQVRPDPAPRLLSIYGDLHTGIQFASLATTARPALADISPREKARREEHNAGVQRLIDEAKSRLAELRRPYEERLFEAKLQALPEAIRADTKAAVQTVAAQRNEVQKYLASKFEGSLRASAGEVAAALSADDSPKVAALEAQLQELPKQLQSWGKIQAVYDVGPAPATYLLVRGNYETPGVEVGPGFITVLSEGDPATLLKETHGLGATSGRRLALARWVTERDTPAAGQVARVMANRVWQQLFGAGIVETTDNFGHSGAMPTHPELLDWLALRFIDDGYRWKPLIKLLMMSTVYRQASALAANELASPGGPQTIDPGNQLLWRQRLRRLESKSCAIGSWPRAASSTSRCSARRFRSTCAPTAPWSLRRKNCPRRRRNGGGACISLGGGTIICRCSACSISQ